MTPFLKADFRLPFAARHLPTPSAAIRVSTVQRYISSSSIHSIENSDALRIGDLIQGAWRFRWSAFLLTMFLIPIFGFLVFLIPVKYTSSARLLVRLGRGAVSIDPTANLSQTVSLQESRLAQVNSVKELLDARELSERVVNRVGVERILEPHGIFETSLKTITDTVSTVMAFVVPSSASKSMGEMSAKEVEDHLKLETACLTFEENVYVTSPKEAYTISLDMYSGDPILSRDLLRAYVDEYQKFHVEAHRATGSLAFFEDQSIVARQLALASHGTLRDAKTNRGIVDIAAAKNSLATSLSVLKQQMMSAESELVATKAEADSLIQRIEEMPENVETLVTRGIPSLAGGNIRQRLYDLEVAYQDAAAKLTPEHPKMINIRQQLEAATKIAEAESVDKPQIQQGVNPVRQSLSLALQTTSAKIVGAEKKRLSLEEQYQQLSLDLESLNTDEVAINELTWEAKLAEDNYLRTATARSTARQIDILDEQNLSEISIVQPPTLILKKASPKRMILVVVGIMLAIAMGFGQAILRSLAIMTPNRDDGLAEEHFYHERKIGSRQAVWADQPLPAIDSSPALSEAEIEGIALTGTAPR